MRVRCRAVRFLPESQPGMIEAYLTDTDGFDWQIVDKTAVFDPALTADSPLPIDVWIPCRVISSAADSVDVVIPDVSDRVYSVQRVDLDPAN